LRQPYVVGLGGTTRANSSTEKALRYALRVAEGEGAQTKLYVGPDLATLPLYAPESPERTDLARALVDDLRRADGVIVGSPGYHGSVSGLVKNALDYTEDMRDDEMPYFAERPVGIIATGMGWQATVTTLEAVRSIVHALRGWATPLGAVLNTTTPAFDAAGEPADERTAFQLATVAQEVLWFARLRISSLETAG